MKRTILLLLAGSAFGAVATYSLMPQGQHPLASIEGLDEDSGEATADAASGSAAERAAALPTARRLALYRTAAAADARALRMLIRDAAQLPPSSPKTFTLDALFARYAELDAAAAVRYAHELEMDTDLLKPLYQAWVMADANEALRALRNLDDAHATHRIALALVEVLGDAEAVVTRLLDSLPQIEAASFRADIIGARAAATPEAALRQALGMSDRVAMRLAVQRVAQAWSRADPLAAVERIETIDDPQLRAVFEEVALHEWAQAAPEAMLEYLAETGARRRPMAMMRGSVIANMARADPLRVLELASRLPSPLNQMATQIGLQTLAEDDPMRALGYVESTSSGPMRQSYIQIIASAYGRRDPEAALEWARSLEPRTPGVLAATLGGIAQVDLERALDVALAETQPARRHQATQSIIMSAGLGGRDQFERIGDRLLAENNLESDQTLSMLTSMWTSTEPETALAWLLANGARVDSRGFGQAARQLGQQDPALAARYTAQVPDEVRPQWIASVAQGYAQTAPEEALSWISQFRNQAGYDEGMAAIVQNMAQADPLRAARLLDGIDGSSQIATMAAANVAGAWAAQDPPAAAEWARRLQNEQTRGVALRSVAQQWAAQDSYSARGWILGLPRGDERDSALGSLIAVSSADGADFADPVLMSAFSSDVSRQRALMPVIFRTGQRDAEAARGIVDDYITDPGLRQQAEQMLSSSRGGGGASVINRGTISQGVSPGFFIP